MVINFVPTFDCNLELLFGFADFVLGLNLVCTSLFTGYTLNGESGEGLLSLDGDALRLGQFFITVEPFHTGGRCCLDVDQED